MEELTVKAAFRYDSHWFPGSGAWMAAKIIRELHISSTFTTYPAVDRKTRETRD
jgi:hypothetical protein